MILLAVLAAFGSAQAQQCDSNTTFYAMTQFNDKAGNAMEFVTQHFYTVADRQACEDACCAHVSRFGNDCEGYTFYTQSAPKAGNCKIYFVPFYQTGEHVQSTKSGVVHYKNELNACRIFNPGLGKVVNFTEITDHSFADQGTYQTDIRYKKINSDTECSDLCCAEQRINCEGYTYDSQNQECILYSEGFMFAPTQNSGAPNRITAMKEDQTCQSSYVSQFDNYHNTTTDKWFKSSQGLALTDGVTTEEDCRDRCCNVERCTGYVWFDGPNGGPGTMVCELEFTNFWLGYQQVSRFGPIYAMRKLQACDHTTPEDPTKLDEVWSEVPGDYPQYTNWQTESWWVAGDEAACAQACCDFPHFKCGGYQYFENHISVRGGRRLQSGINPQNSAGPGGAGTGQAGSISTVGGTDYNCLLMMEGFEQSGLVEDSNVGEIHHGIKQHHSCTANWQRVQDPLLATNPQGGYFQTRLFKTVNTWQDCEYQCSANRLCQGFQFYDSANYHPRGNCVLLMTVDFEQGMMEYASFGQNFIIRAKNADGSFRDTVRPALNIEFVTHVWRATGSEDACRNLCCNWAAFPCTMYTYYPEVITSQAMGRGRGGRGGAPGRGGPGGPAGPGRRLQGGGGGGGGGGPPTGTRAPAPPGAPGSAGGPGQQGFNTQATSNNKNRATGTHSNGAQDNDCKLMMNADPSMMQPGTWNTTAPVHGQVNDYLKNMCANFVREVQYRQNVQFYDTNIWFDVNSRKECEQMTCDNNAMSYSYYSNSKTKYGNCKVVFGDMTNGIHKPSSKTGILHGVTLDASVCKYTDWTTHVGASASSSGYYSAYAWSEAVNEEECQKRCCDNTDGFYGGCGGYSYYRPGDRPSKDNCKTLMNTAHASNRATSDYLTWGVHAIIGGVVPKPTHGNSCGYALKKIKIKGSKPVTSSKPDACACAATCLADPFWEFNVKKKRCTCHTGRLNKIRVNKVKQMKVKRAGQAKVIASTDQKHKPNSKGRRRRM